MNKTEEKKETNIEEKKETKIDEKKETKTKEKKESKIKKRKREREEREQEELKRIHIKIVAEEIPRLKEYYAEQEQENRRTEFQECCIDGCGHYFPLDYLYRCTVCTGFICEDCYECIDENAELDDDTVVCSTDHYQFFINNQK